MSETLLATGSVWTLSSLGGYESKIAEGDTGRLDVSLRSGLPSAVVEGIGASIRKAGVSLTSIWQENNTLHIQAVKKIGFLVIIAAAIAAAIIMVALVLSWKLFKLSPAAVVASIGIWLALIAGACVIAILVWKRGSS